MSAQPTAHLNATSADSVLWWPTPAQTWLLHAALDDGDAALDAWSHWRAAVDLNALDGGSRRLLPLLWSNLNRLHVDAPEMSALKSTYVETWMENGRLFRPGLAAARALEAAGVETAVLKGVANAVLYYRDVARRPMSDFDLLVRLEQTERAFAILDGLGWQRKAIPSTRLRYIHGIGLTNGSGQGLDLHWAVLAESAFAGGSERFWAGVVPATIEGVDTHALNPADQLLHLITHGARRSVVPPIRWVADSIILIRATPALDWARLVEMAGYYRVSLITERLLTYLQATFDVPIPVKTLDNFHDARRAWYERADYYGRRQSWQTIPFHAFNFIRIREHAATKPGLFHFLRDWWGLKSVWQVPGEVVSFTAAQLGRHGPSDE